MARTWDALLQAERTRERTREFGDDDDGSPGVGLHCKEDLAAIQVSVHALEDRVENDLRSFGEEVRETITKAAVTAAEQSSAKERDLELRFREDLAAVRIGLDGVERRASWSIGLLAFVVVLTLFRC